MRAHFLQHVPFEGLGSIEHWLRSNEAEVTETQLYASPELPNPRDLDLLIVMGGPMSVNDEDRFPWLIDEKRFIRSAIDAGKAILGVCLGAQLIASAMGARVYRNRVKEIGWFPVQGVSPSDRPIFPFPSTMEVFHWHGETFDLPPGAVRLAKSAVCENQAFQLGRTVIGLQFHLETTLESAQEIVTHCRAELSPSQYVQSEKDILAAPPEKYRAVNRLLARMLSFLCG